MKIQLWTPLAIPLFTLSLSGCVDLTAVSDFAKLGSGIAADTTAVDSRPDAVKYAARFNTDPKEAAKLAGEVTQVQAQAKAASLGLHTLSLYLSTLANLADDKTVDVTASGKTIGASLKTLGVVDASTQAPATALIQLLTGGALDIWRREEATKLIEQADPSVQSLCKALADLATDTSRYYSNDISQVDIYYYNFSKTEFDIMEYYNNIVKNSGHRDENQRYIELEMGQSGAVSEMLTEWRDGHKADFAKARDQAAVAAAALTKIAEGHGKLLEALKAGNSLSSKEVKALLAKYSDELSAAAKIIIGG